MAISMFGLNAVQAARPGLQPLAAMDTETHTQKCEDFYRVQSMKINQHMCKCNKKAPYPSKACGQIGRTKDYKGRWVYTFKLRAAHQTCLCLKAVEKSKEKSTLVQVAAIRFCSAIVEVTGMAVPLQLRNNLERRTTMNHLNGFMNRNLTLTPELCSEVLTGTLGSEDTLDTSGTSKKRSLFAEANNLSKHEGAKGLGHLDPLISGAMPSPQKYQHLLHRVCRDECEEIINNTIKNMYVMLKDDVKVRKDVKSLEETCADRVVRKAEAELLGCCGQACGWNNKSCSSWPFFTKEEKVDWLEECCSEYNVLQNSSRERMCTSVLTPQQVQLITKGDTKARRGTDVAGSYIGQDPVLLWTKKGIKKFRSQLKKLKAMPKKDDRVSSIFLENNPKIHKEGLEKGWFTEETIAKKQQRPTSLVQISKCNLKDMGQCPPDQKRQRFNVCTRHAHWQVTDTPDSDDHESCDKMIRSATAIPVDTPDDCIKIPKANFSLAGEIQSRFFMYKNMAQETGPELTDVIPTSPIMCHAASKADADKCGGEDFIRTDLNQIASENERKDLEDFLYWIDESKVQSRLQELAQSSQNNVP